MKQKAAALSGDGDDNTVALRGRVSSAPTERELPSGAVITTFRLSVPRARTADDVRVDPELGLGGLRGLERAKPGAASAAGRSATRSR